MNTGTPEKDSASTKPATMDVETARRLLRQWEHTGSELDQIRWQELRTMSEAESQRKTLVALRAASQWLKRNPGWEKECGLIQQQQIFAACR